MPSTELGFALRHINTKLMLNKETKRIRVTNFKRAETVKAI